MSQEQIEGLKRKAQHLQETVQALSKTARKQKDRVHRNLRRDNHRCSELAFGVFLISGGDRDVHRRFCEKHNLDTDTSHEKLNQIILELPEKELDESFMHWSHGAAKLAREARQFVEDSSLFSWIESLNLEVGVAPTYNSIMAQRMELARTSGMMGTPKYKSTANEKQWTRRFVKRQALYRGSITQQPNASRTALLEQASG